jgi:SAM-dependent methyltransferase
VAGSVTAQAFMEISNEQSIQDTVNKRCFSKASVIDGYRQVEAIDEAEKAILQRLRASIKDKKLLDIGIGGGRTTGYLIEISGDYTGVDYIHDFVQIARTKYPGVPILHADARDLNMFEDEAFDFVLFSYNGIDYVPHEGRLRALSEIRRVLKPSGYFMFSTHNRDYGYPRRLPWQEGLPLSLSQIKSCFEGVGYWFRHLMMRKHEVDTDEYAMINDNAHGFSLLTYYIRVDAQINQLQSLGFTNVEVYNLDGKRVEFESEFPWTYYLATKALVQSA